jgi:hypothetical protein
MRTSTGTYEAQSEHPGERQTDAFEFFL